MFRTRKHVRAKPNEWIVVHRSPERRIKKRSAVEILVIGALGLVALMIIWEIVAWIWGLFVAAIPFLIIASVVAAVVFSIKKKS